MAANCERTFIAIKPDGVQRGLVGEIIKRFEQKGFKLVAMKFVHASEELLKQHYIDLKDRPFYPGLVKYMNSGPVVAMVWEGLNVVKTGRVMLGETNPADSKPGTIRGDFCIQVGRLQPIMATWDSGWVQNFLKLSYVAELHKHHPRQRLCRKRPEGDQPVVQSGRAHRLQTLCT
ncbi:nucleoside diphosphate kinase isoform X2 [Coturnix japonica]|uniref:nucleoside diphosphate kinase isoform X2 n=1 Tax=Coturnix japonica TaxID=93934 RepID=UPI0013A5D4BF|nr:nucleoside diphosphate kinase isoform X2 [Coturnix japonica]